MCNLYSMTRTQEAMRQLFAPMSYNDNLGNLPPLKEIYPNQAAPILRNTLEAPEMVMCRWGMPTPPQFLTGKKTDRGVTNIRNTASMHWKRWFGTSHRCLVPFTSFAEPDTVKGGNAWFSLFEDRPACFAGLHLPQWPSVRKVSDGVTIDDLFAILTTEPNAEVAQVHPKAMPVILNSPNEWDIWMNAPWSEAKILQRPLPDGALALI